EDCLRNLDLNPDYIILDYNLNSVNTSAANGLEILKKIKEEKPDVFVIFLSGQEKIEIAVDTIKYGAYDYVVKNQSSFLRIENCLINIHKNLRLAYLAKVYRFSTFVLGGILLGIVIMAILFKIFGISAANPGWF
ncbi:MAG: response regulator, partial [Bacteroidota bacterium]